MNVSYIMTEDSLTIAFIESGQTYTIGRTNPNWDAVVEKLNSEDYDSLEDLLSPKTAVRQYVMHSMLVEVDDGGVKYAGKYIDSYLTQKVLSFMEKGLPVKPLLNFFEKVMKNPSRRSVQELYKFLEHGSMPILPNGNFMGYKAVKEDWTDYHTGKCSNTIGIVLEMPRNEVCDDPELGCSYGYHVGTIEYARGFGQNNGRVLLVEVDPADVVSVPHDCNHQKLRTSKYKVVKEFERVLKTDYDDEFDDNEDTYDFTSRDLIESEIEELWIELKDTENSNEASEILARIKELQSELD
jgi:hypothetical protein